MCTPDGPCSTVTQFRFVGQYKPPSRHPDTSKQAFQPPNIPTTFTMAYTNGFEQSIPHQQEKNLPGGGNWVVQKFGGTSVGKFAVDIAQDIVMYVVACPLWTEA